MAKDWTEKGGRANSSDAFKAAVRDVANVIRNTRIGDDPEFQARLIVARLAHNIPFLRREP